MEKITSLITIGSIMTPDLAAETPLMTWKYSGTKYIKVKNAAPIDKAAIEPQATLLCEAILGGRVALSPRWSWMKIKQTNKTPAMQRSKTILQLLQGYALPPHCSPSKVEIIPGNKKGKLTKSRSSNFSRIVPVFNSPCRGWKKNPKRSTVITPIGRLI
jgi:hypothetical protein